MKLIITITIIFLLLLFASQYIDKINFPHSTYQVTEDASHIIVHGCSIYLGGGDGGYLTGITVRNFDHEKDQKSF